MRAEDHTALAELRGGLRAVPGTSRPLLAVPFGGGPAHLTARLGVVRAAPAVGVDAQDGLVDECIVAFDAEDAIVQLDRGDDIACGIADLCLCHVVLLPLSAVLLDG